MAIDAEERTRICEEMGERPVKLNEDLGAVVFVDGVPIAPVAKYQKLVQFTLNMFGKLGAKPKGGSMFMPLDEEGKNTKGYCFLEFSSRNEAQEIAAKADKMMFDKSHMLRVSTWDDVERTLQTEEKEYEPPQLSDLSSQGNLRSWLLDQFGRDQYLVRHSDETEIWWNDPIRGGRDLVYAGEAQKEENKTWTDSYAVWSPQGSYVATFHQPGLAIWGTDSFQRFGRLPHRGLELVSFSPCERYVLTFNGLDSKEKSDPDCFIFWDIRSGRKLRGLSGGAALISRRWPVFKWSYDGKFVARIFEEEESIQVFELPSMILVGKSSIKVSKIVDFEWSPSENILAYWVPEQDNVPASVSLLALPSKKIVSEKHLFQVTDIKFHWHNTGEYLGVRVTRMKKKGKATGPLSCNLEIFRMKEKNIPIESVEVDDEVTGFEWEPNGPRFAYMKNKPPRTEIVVCSMKKTKVKQEFSVPNKSVNYITWSPAGNFMVFAGLGSSLNGSLEFFAVNSKHSMTTQEHFQCSDLQWDPSGRYLATFVKQPLHPDANSWRFASNNGYRIWNVIGELLFEQSLSSLYQFLWRPRPQTLLSPEKTKEISKSLRDKYYRQFDEQDTAARESQLSGEAKKKAEAKAAFKALREAQMEEYRKQEDARKALRGSKESIWEEIDIQVEEEISTTVDILEE